MRNRGNADEFIRKMTNKEDWNKFYIENKNDTKATHKIELNENQYLSDIKDLLLRIDSENK